MDCLICMPVHMCCNLQFLDLQNIKLLVEKIFVSKKQKGRRCKIRWRHLIRINGHTQVQTKLLSVSRIITVNTLAPFMAASCVFPCRLRRIVGTASHHAAAFMCKRTTMQIKSIAGESRHINELCDLIRGTTTKI